jgi:peptide/nickel transport system substrate-binding protein
MLFLQGKLDFINSLDSSYKDELLTPTGQLQENYKNRLELLNGPYLNTEYIGIYLENSNPAIQSPKIREALNIGFDRKLMIAYLRNNIGYPAKKGFIPKGLAGSSEQDFNYSPEKARKLVEEFIKGTNSTPRLTLTTDANYLDLCEYLQREMQKIGIALEVEVMPTATLRQAKSSGKLELFRASWIADYPDAENYLSLFYSTNFSPNGPNYTHYQNKAFDSLYRLAMDNIKRQFEDSKIQGYGCFGNATTSYNPPLLRRSSTIYSKRGKGNGNKSHQFTRVKKRL